MLADFLKHEIGQTCRLTFRSDRRKCHQTMGFTHRELAQNQRIEEAEDCRVCTYAESQGEHGNSGEPRVLEQGANAVMEVVEHGV